MKRNVLYLDHSPKFGGSGRVLLNFIGKLNQEDIFPILVCPIGSNLNEIFENKGMKVELISMPWFTRKAPILEFLSYPFYLGLAAFHIRKIIDKYKIVLIHANTFIAVLYALIPARITQKPLIWHMHDILDLNFLNKIFVRLAARGSDKIICVSEAVQESLIKFGVSPLKCKVVYNFIEETKTQGTNREMIRKEFNLQEKGLLVGMIGQICKLKGQTVFVQAISKILQEFPTARFFIVGDLMSEFEKGYKKELEELIHEKNLQKRIYLTGFRKDVFEIMGEMDIIVLPSIEPEAFPMVILEAFGLEKPVVATHIGGISEMIVDGLNGMLVPPNDPVSLSKAISNLLSDQNLRTKMGKEGKKILFEKFKPEISIEKLNQVYNELT